MFDVKKYIMSVNPEALGVSSVSLYLVEKLGGGILNHTYKCVINGKEFIFRARGDYISDVNPVKTEFDLLKKIETLHIGPKPYYYGVFDGKEFVLLEFIHGIFVNEFTDSIVTELAGVYARLHSVKPVKRSGSFYVHRLNDIVSKYERVKSSLSVSQCGFIEELINHFKKIKLNGEKVGIIHGDAHKGNILITGDGLRLIDFDFVSYDDPAFEVAQILSEMGLSNHEKDVFLRAYIKLVKNVDLMKRVSVYTSVFYLESLLWCLERQLETKGKEVPEGINPEYFVTEARDRLSQLIKLGLINEKHRNEYMVK